MIFDPFSSTAGAKNAYFTMVFCQNYICHFLSKLQEYALKLALILNRDKYGTVLGL